LGQNLVNNLFSIAFVLVFMLRQQKDQKNKKLIFKNLKFSIFKKKKYFGKNFLIKTYYPFLENLHSKWFFCLIAILYISILLKTNLNSAKKLK